MTRTTLLIIIISALVTTSTLATTLTKINEQYGDRGLYETFKLSNSSSQKCQFTLLAAEEIIEMQCVKKVDGSTTSYCTRDKASCVTQKEIFYFAENGKMPAERNNNYSKNRKIKLNLPFIGAKQTKNGRTKITISKNGGMTIYSYFKNGYKTHYKGKYTKDLIPEDANIPMHGWKVYKSKVCQGYRNTWDCQKLYSQ